MTPAMMEDNVDFPAPFSPNNAITSLGAMSIEMSDNTSTPPYRLLIPEVESPVVGLTNRAEVSVGSELTFREVMETAL